MYSNPTTLVPRSHFNIGGHEIEKRFWKENREQEHKKTHTHIHNLRQAREGLLLS